MNKKTVKIISGILLAILLIGFMGTFVFAEDEATSGTPITPEGLSSSISYGDSTGMQSMAGKVMGLIRNVAVIAGVIILMVIGVKYILGSVEEKAEYKKTLIPLVIGIIVVMAATTIMTFVVNFFSGE